MIIIPQALSDGWNELRNLALGRGTTPRVSAELAARVGTEYESWRRWIAGSLSDDLLRRWQARPDQGPPGAVGWYERYRALHAEVARELAQRGEAVTDPYYSPLDSAQRIAERAASSAGQIATIGLSMLKIAAVAIPLVATVLAVRRGRA